MPDRRRHRGPHPADAQLFGAAAVAGLRRAVEELSWLMSRGYSDVAALKLVGDRHRLRKRQRDAVMRCSCSDEQRDDRAGRRLELDRLADRRVLIDGFNCIITSEVALGGGVVLRGRDGCHRDLSSVYGSYRTVDETSEAIEAIAALLAEGGVAQVTWYLDRPVSNSGRLAARIRDIVTPIVSDCDVELVFAPDKALVEAPVLDVVASSDSWVLDHCGAWIDLPGVLAHRRRVAVVELGIAAAA